MNRFINKTIVVAFSVVALVSVLHAQEQPAAVVEAEPTTLSQPSVTDIATPDKEGVFPSIMHKGDIRDFLKFLAVAGNKNIVPSNNVRGQVSVNLFNVTARETLDAVLSTNGYAHEAKGSFIYVYTKKEYEEKQAAARKTESRIFNLNYISAVDAVALISPLLSDAGQITCSPKVEASGSAGGSGETWAGSNSLLLVDYPENVKTVAEALKKIDKRPSQVLVEATILVASLDDTNELGIDFNVLGGVDFQSTNGNFHPDPTPGVTLGGTTTGAMTEFTGNLSPGGLSIGIVKNNLGVFIKAIESITDVVTLGNPKVLTLNRQMGKVIVGNRDGYITTEASATTTTQKVEFLETGTQLSFTPFVMDDGYIRMELNPKDSDGGVVVVGQFTLPSETTAEVTTNVLVKDGHTIVIGGLFREKTTLGRSQVPLLGNIPLFGKLFKATSDRNAKEEVIFLITPRIVKDDVEYAAAEEVLDTCNRLILGGREGMNVLSRERLANAHYHKARELQAEGELDCALWHANLALYASPVFLDAVDLRNELYGRNVYQGEYGNMRLFVRRLLEADK